MANNGAQTAFFAARPTIRIEGKIEDSLGDVLLQSLMVEETVMGLFRCEASFLNWGPKDNAVGFLLFDRELLDFGKAFSVEFGPPTAEGPVFAGRITGLEGVYPPARPPELLVLAEDRFQDLRMERRTRSFEEMTDADVARAIASDHSLTAEVDIDGPTHAILTQVNQSDLAFLRERMAAVDAELWMDNRTLYAQARARRNAGTATFTYGQTLLEFKVLADLAHQRTSVRVSGWYVAGKQALEAEASESAISSELEGGRSGTAVLGQALAPRHERIVSGVPLTQDEAQALADARYRQRARGFLRGTGVVDGNIKIRVGATVDLRELGDFFDGPYTVTRARHTFDLISGYRTTFDVERPAIGG